MTEAELQEIEERVWGVDDAADDAVIDTLIAEVRRLQSTVEGHESDAEDRRT